MIYSIGKNIGKSKEKADRFAQSLLGKATSDTYDILIASSNDTVSGNEMSLNDHPYYTKYVRDSFTYTATNNLTCKYKIEFSRYNYMVGSTQTLRTEIYKNDTKVLDINTNPPHIGNIDLSSGEVFKIKYQATSATYTANFTRTLVSLSIPLSKTSESGYKPREVSNLGIGASVTTFGRHIDGTRVNHD